MSFRSLLCKPCVGINALMLLFVLAFTVSGCAGGSPTSSNQGTSSETVATAEPAKELTPGHKVFLNNCMGCHSNGEKPPGPNNIILRSSKPDTLRHFEAFVRNPDNGKMPPFPIERLSNAELGELYIYIHNRIEEQR